MVSCTLATPLSALQMNRIFLVRELEKDQEPFAVCAELFVSITNIYLTVVSPLVVKVGFDAF